MDSVQLLQWLVVNLKARPKVARLDVMEKLLELQRRILSTEGEAELLTNDTVENLVDTLRKIRSVRQNVLLEEVYELDILGTNVRTSLAHMLFEIEVLITYKLRIEKWNREIENNEQKKWQSVTVSVEKLKHLETVPEKEFLRLPMTQLVNNLMKLTAGNASQYFSIEEFETIVEGLFERAVVLCHTELPEEDMDLVEYTLKVIPVDESETTLYRTNHLFLAEMRYFFDTLFEMSLLCKWQQKLTGESPASPAVGVEDIKKFVVDKCKNFEREYFLEQFTDYVLDLKLNCRLLRDLYGQKFPDVSKPDSRRIIKHFLGQDCVVEYSNFRYITDIFDEIEYAYEFAFLFYLKMILQENPVDTKNKRGYILRNPMNAKEFTYFNAEATKCTEYGSFIQSACHYLNNGHSRLQIP